MDKGKDKLTQIAKELQEEIRVMYEEDRIYEFDKAMVNAMEKCKEQVKKLAKAQMERCTKEEDKKKLSDLRQKDENQ